MPKGKPADKAARGAWEVDFIHLELGAEDKANVKKYDLQCEATIDTLSRLSMDGWKLSVVYDSRNECSLASLTSPKNDGRARQVCLSARGPDLMQSLRVLCYKINVILDGDLSSLENTAEQRSQWG